jgi:hypothetical protein
MLLLLFSIKKSISIIEAPQKYFYNCLTKPKWLDIKEVAGPSCNFLINNERGIT